MVIGGGRAQKDENCTANRLIQCQHLEDTCKITLDVEFCAALSCFCATPECTVII